MKTVRIKMIETNTSPDKSKTRHNDRIGKAIHGDPQVGRSFMILDQGGEGDGFVTSIVREITPRADGWIIKTMNSVYEVIVLDDPDVVLQ